MTGIYKIIFSNNHYYIGQSVNTNRRFSQHKRELKKGIHSNSRLQNCYNKYGEPVFEVIQECLKTELDLIETKYLYENVDNELCCNFCKIGKSAKGIKRTEEYKEKISAYQHLSGKVKPVYMFSRDENFLLAKFSSIREAEKAINCYPKDIQKSCKSNGKYNVQKYKFRYTLPVDNFLNYIKDLVPF